MPQQLWCNSDCLVVGHVGVQQQIWINLYLGASKIFDFTNSLLADKLMELHILLYFNPILL